MDRSQYPPMIRTVETAEILGISIQAVRRLLREGKIFGFKLGEEQAHDEWRILTDSVFEYRAELASQPGEDVPVEDGN